MVRLDLSLAQTVTMRIRVILPRPLTKTLVAFFIGSIFVLFGQVAQAQNSSKGFYLGANAKTLIPIFEKDFPSGDGVFYNACVNTKNASTYDDVYVLVVGRNMKVSYLYQITGIGAFVPNFAAFEIKDGKIDLDTLQIGSGGMGVQFQFSSYVNFLLQEPFQFTNNYDRIIKVKPKLTCPYYKGLPVG